MLTRHAHNRRSRNRLLRGRSARRGGGGAPLTLRQQIGQVLGVEPQVFADARDLTVGDGNTVATWGDTSSNGSPLLDADGWGGSLPLVTFDGASQILRADAASGAFTYETAFVVAMTASLPAPDATQRALFALTRVGGGTPQHVLGRFTNDTAFCILRDGTVVDDAFGLTFNQGPLLHFGYAFYSGGTRLMTVLDSGGTATLINDTPDTLSEFPAAFDRLTLMGRGSGTGTINYMAGGLGIVSITRCSAGAATPANLAAVLNLHNQAYPVA